jgi:hypothetical protein
MILLSFNRGLALKTLDKKTRGRRQIRMSCGGEKLKNQTIHETARIYVPFAASHQDRLVGLLPEGSHHLLEVF